MKAAVAATALAALLCGAARAQSYEHTGSRSTFVHRLALRDADGREIDPSAADAPPYSPRETCKTCHDVGAIAHGWHTDAMSAESNGRPGEPWIWTDPRTGTALPVSYRGWPGTWRPDAIGMDPARFVKEFGRHLPGGVGDLEIDCIACHDAGHAWSHDAWADEIAAGRLAGAPGVALGLRKPGGGYDARRFDASGKVFFDVLRTPTNDACYRCHSTERVGDGAPPHWLTDEDVHLRAGMRCADCHRNGLEHHTVRGYEGESRGDGTPIASLTCRGCHLDATNGDGEIVSRGGRLGAPRPAHRGLPPIHLAKLTCTACHSGPRPDGEARTVQTAMAHGLGLPSQTRSAGDLPGIVEPVFARQGDSPIGVFRYAWPSFWGWQTGAAIEPMSPDDAFATVRRAFRVRKDLRAEVTDVAKFRDDLATALAAFAKTRTDAKPVFVSGGKAYRLDVGGAIETFDDLAAAPVAWPLAHDVRPARASLGVRGCVECHADGSPMLHGTVTARGPMPVAEPPTTDMIERTGLDRTLVAGWEQAFRGRDAFKWVGLGAVSLIALVLLANLLVGVDAITRVFRRRPDRDSGEDAV